MARRRRCERRHRHQSVARVAAQHPCALCWVSHRPAARHRAERRYAQRLSLDSVEDIPDVNEGILKAAIVHRFGDGTWIRAVPALVIDYRQRGTWGRVEAEWGRVLTGGASTWVRGGGMVGASRPFDWALAVGFRFVQ